MNRFASIIKKPLMWPMALLITALAAGCGGNGTDPILGGGVNVMNADPTRPRVTFTVPASGVTAVPTNRKITATFSEDMALASIPAAFTLTCATPCVSPTGNNVSYLASSRTATLTPGSAMATNTLYTATITTAATDLAGNALAGNPAAPTLASNYVWTFTTGAGPDSTAPTITSTIPVDAASGVVVDRPVKAIFSEPMDAATFTATSFTLQQSGIAATIAGTVTYDAPTQQASFKPTSALTPNTIYIATVTNSVQDLAGLALVAGGVPNPWTFTTGSGLATGATALGSAGSFGIMATAAITNVGNSIINGDVSLDPGTSMTGFPPGTVNGEIHINDTVSAQARNDLLTAYNTAKSKPPGTTIAAGADLGALYPSGIPPGTYTSGSTMLVSTPLTLDAGGNTNAVWTFQIGSSLTTSANVSLLNGAQAKNVFWVPTSDATIGVGTTFHGTIVSGRDVTAVTGATINGRILAGAITDGTIALQSSTVNVPAP